MISIRLPSEIESEVREAAAAYDVSTSEFVRRALMEKLAAEQQRQHPWSLGEGVFGKYSSGDNNRSETVEQRLRKKLRTQHNNASL